MSSYPYLTLNPGGSIIGLFRGRGAGVGRLDPRFTWLFDPVMPEVQGFRIVYDKMIRCPKGARCRVSRSTDGDTIKIEIAKPEGEAVMVDGTPPKIPEALTDAILRSGE